jgi:hypothetical protein
MKREEATASLPDRPTVLSVFIKCSYTAFLPSQALDPKEKGAIGKLPILPPA